MPLGLALPLAIQPRERLGFAVKILGGGIVFNISLIPKSYGSAVWRFH